MADFLELDYLEVKQDDKIFLLTKIPAGILTTIAYAAVRNKDKEAGAVQRTLVESRIAGVKEFAKTVGDFPASVVLNWNSDPIEFLDGRKIRISIRSNITQIIDGQHRIAGIRAAIEEKPALADVEIPAAIYSNLDTRECANIFLSINTEQKPVPRSLIIDLFGVANEELADMASIRARDVVDVLNMPGHTYDGLIKYPNSQRSRGGVQLSTAVSALKPLVEAKGTFEQVGIESLSDQALIVDNFFNALSSKYLERWGERDNAFIYASGFTGAVEFLQLKMIPYCVQKENFTEELMATALRMDTSSLIYQDEVKGVGGKDAPRMIYERLVGAFTPEVSENKIYKI